MYRNLSTSEIQQLQSNGCTAIDWSEVCIEDPFFAEKIHNVNFTGRVYLDSGVELFRVANLGSTGETSYANGLEVSVLKEDGGLEVIIHDRLTAMEAAFEVQETNRQPKIVKKLQESARTYAAKVKSDGSRICSGAIVRDVRELTDVFLGPGTQVIGSSRLKDVSINAIKGPSTYIGDGVILEHVIVASESHISDGVQLDNCFVGQGCHIGRMYSATQSLFFANCHFENGEACAYFAGPYSVSHHKATLLIACQTSFFNAGSGSNQSNHSYKMGPNKYGQLQRGAKLGSSSYVYWPMQIGAFSTVIGHHVGHQDLRNLPFSLVTEGSDGRTVVVPAQSLRSVGTRRDSLKWPKRDKRSEYGRLDIIDFTLFNPVTVSAILRGIDVLEELKKDSKTDYQGCSISRKHQERGLLLYKQVLDIYVAQELDAEGDVSSAIMEKVNARGLDAIDTSEWCDYGGMIAPALLVGYMLEHNYGWEEINSVLPYFRHQWLISRFDVSNLESVIARGKKALDIWNKALDADGELDIANTRISLI